MEKVSSGIAGLDSVLHGGFPGERVYLVEGDPGTGKTTLALQFLLEGARRNESTLFITLSESRLELEASAHSHDWDLSDLAIREYVATPQGLTPDEQLTMFNPSEVELLETIQRILSDLSELNPARVVIDSLSEIRLLSQDGLRYRRQLLALKQFFVQHRSTVILLDDRTFADTDRHVHSIVHGVLRLEQLSPDYGAERRRLRLTKVRGTSYRGGWHDYTIKRGGVEVYPRIVAAEHRAQLHRQHLSSGVPGLDALLGGGIRTGTSTLLLGPAGAGKTTVASQFAITAAARGQKVAMFVFEETADLLCDRAEAIGLPLARLIDDGRIRLTQIDPAELSPGEFACRISAAVDDFGATMVVVDSLNGYLAAMPEERQLQAQLHELLTFLGQRGVATLLVMGQQGMLGAHVVSPVDASYLADTIILLRYFEVAGRVRKAISVVKSRTDAHENTIRELWIGAGGIVVGEALEQFRGILTGTPVFEGFAGLAGDMLQPPASGSSSRDQQ
jgi:circadian clock protein KaiC